MIGKLIAVDSADVADGLDVGRGSDLDDYGLGLSGVVMRLGKHDAYGVLAYVGHAGSVVDQDILVGVGGKACYHEAALIIDLLINVAADDTVDITRSLCNVEAESSCRGTCPVGSGLNVCLYVILANVKSAVGVEELVKSEIACAVLRVEVVDRTEVGGSRYYGKILVDYYGFGSEALDLSRGLNDLISVGDGKLKICLSVPLIVRIDKRDVYGNGRTGIDCAGIGHRVNGAYSTAKVGVKSAARVGELLVESVYLGSVDTALSNNESDVIDKSGTVNICGDESRVVCARIGGNSGNGIHILIIVLYSEGAVLCGSGGSSGLITEGPAADCGPYYPGVLNRYDPIFKAHRLLIGGCPLVIRGITESECCCVGTVVDTAGVYHCIEVGIRKAECLKSTVIKYSVGMCGNSHVLLIDCNGNRYGTSVVVRVRVGCIYCCEGLGACITYLGLKPGPAALIIKRKP